MNLGIYKFRAHHKYNQSSKTDNYYNNCKSTIIINKLFEKNVRGYHICNDCGVFVLVVGIIRSSTRVVLSR